MEQAPRVDNKIGMML